MGGMDHRERPACLRARLARRVVETPGRIADQVCVLRQGSRVVGKSRGRVDEGGGRGTAADDQVLGSIGADLDGGARGACPALFMAAPTSATHRLRLFAASSGGIQTLGGRARRFGRTFWLGRPWPPPAEPTFPGYSAKNTDALPHLAGPAAPPCLVTAIPLFEAPQGRATTRSRTKSRAWVTGKPTVTRRVAESRVVATILTPSAPSEADDQLARSVEYSAPTA